MRIVHCRHGWREVRNDGETPEVVARTLKALTEKYPEAPIHPCMHPGQYSCPSCQIEWDGVKPSPNLQCPNCGEPVKDGLLAPDA